MLLLELSSPARRRIPLAGALLLGLTGWFVSHDVVAQEGEAAKSPRELVEIEPYTGPPIYLPEGEAPPEPKAVESKVIVEKFPNSEVVRFERRMTRYSDNSYKSDGPHKEFYSDGQLYVEGEFTKGRATGAWTYYHPNGSVAKKVGYVDGKPDGEIRVQNAEGKLVAVRRYANGQREGAWEAYTEDGATKIREENYAGGRANGLFRIWFPNGQLRREVRFVDGKQEGLTAEWSVTGEKRAEVNFKNGLRDGVATIWRRDGKKVIQNYSEGKRVANP